MPEPAVPLTPRGVLAPLATPTRLAELIVLALMDPPPPPSVEVDAESPVDEMEDGSFLRGVEMEEEMLKGCTVVVEEVEELNVGREERGGMEAGDCAARRRWRAIQGSALASAESSASEGRTTHGRIRLESSIRVPRQAFVDKVDKELVVRLEHLRQRLPARSSSASLGVRHRSWSTCRI